MQPGDIGNHAGHFIVVEWRLAPHPIPGQQEFERDLRIDAMPQQMASQRSNGRIAFALIDALAHQMPPVF